MQTEKTLITVHAVVYVPVEEVWEKWTNPAHIIGWNHASDVWHTTRSENDLHVGGKFLSRMEAKDGSMGFDFEGIYDLVVPYKLIEYRIVDGRKVTITFGEENNQTVVNESFEAEDINSAELQQTGWQSILNNFKSY